MWLFTRIASIVRAPAPDDDPACREHRTWMNDFKVEEIPANELVFEQARRIYEEFRRGYDIIDAKAADVVKSSGLMVTIFGAAIGALKLDANSFVFLALGSFLLSIVLGLRARTPLKHAGAHE